VQASKREAVLADGTQGKNHLWGHVPSRIAGMDHVCLRAIPPLRRTCYVPNSSRFAIGLSKVHCVKWSPTSSCKDSQDDMHSRFQFYNSYTAGMRLRPSKNTAVIARRSRVPNDRECLLFLLRRKVQARHCPQLTTRLQEPVIALPNLAPFGLSRKSWRTGLRRRILLDEASSAHQVVHSSSVHHHNATTPSLATSHQKLELNSPSSSTQQASSS
jgi:hypothetical protein